MKLTALYKTFDGTEFLFSSIESIYNHVDNIAFVHSDISWAGEEGNKVAIEVEKWKSLYDKQNKIISIWFNTQSQEEQYNHGLKCIQNHIGQTFVLFIDTDEVWDEDELIVLKAGLIKNPNFNAYTVKLKTYIKSPFYQIFPPEPLQPITVIKSSVKAIEGPRGCLIKPQYHIDCFFHHFTAVRRSFEDVKKKIITSHIGDNAEHIELRRFQAKWDSLPKSENLHYTKGCEANWKRVRIVKEEDLPITVRNKPELLKIGGI